MGKKYIDVEKLKAEIKAREKVHFEDYHIKKSGGPADYGAANALHQLLPVIDSLQQEQISLPDNLGKAAEEYAKGQLGYCDDDPDDENLCWQPLYFAFKAGAKWMTEKSEQEQPEVDLEKEIDRYCEPIQAWQVQEAPFTSLENCARHFAEWGAIHLNVRKGE